MRTEIKSSTILAQRAYVATAMLAIVASLAQPVAAMPAQGMVDQMAEHLGDGMGDGMGEGMRDGMREGMGGPGMMAGRHREHMLDSVGASAEQKTQLRQIMDTARTDLKPLREAARTLRRQMQGLFTQPTVDARAVETLRLQMQGNHEQASKRMTQAMLDASRVLSPEQRKQMAERLEQRRGMMQRHRSERESLEGAAPGGPRRP